MATLSKRTTVYFAPKIHSALGQMAARSGVSMSELVNEAVRLIMLEEQQDLSTIKERMNEPELSYEQLLTSLRRDKKI